MFEYFDSFNKLQRNLQIAHEMEEKIMMRQSVTPDQLSPYGLWVEEHRKGCTPECLSDHTKTREVDPSKIGVSKETIEDLLNGKKCIKQYKKAALLIDAVLQLSGYNAKKNWEEYQGLYRSGLDAFMVSKDWMPRTQLLPNQPSQEPPAAENMPEPPSGRQALSFVRRRGQLIIGIMLAAFVILIVVTFLLSPKSSQSKSGITITSFQPTASAQYFQNEAPEIVVAEVPAYGDSNGDVRGKILNTKTFSEYRLLTYIRVQNPENRSDLWYSKPYLDKPFETLAPDGSFVVDITTGGLDEKATMIELYLVPKDIALWNAQQQLVAMDSIQVPEVLEQGGYAYAQIIRSP